MNSYCRMEFVLLLLMIATTIKQLESANCTLNYYDHQNHSGIEMAEISYQGLNGTLCNLSVTATESIEECLEDIQIVNNSCIFNQTRDSHTITTTETLYTTQIVATTSKEIVTITHTQEVYSKTTIISICPTPTPSLREDIDLMYTTRCPATTTSRVLSNVTEIGILTTCGVLICLPITMLVIVTYCWARTRQSLKKTRNGVNLGHSAQDSLPRCKNTSEATTLHLDNNPAYDTQTPLQTNLAYEDIALTTSKPPPKEHQTPTNTQELAYEIVPLISCQSASTTTHTQTPLQRNLAYEDTTLKTSKPQPKECQTPTNTQELAYEIAPLISCQSASTASSANVIKNREVEGGQQVKTSAKVTQL